MTDIEVNINQGWEFSAKKRISAEIDFGLLGNRFWPPRILFLALADPLFKKKSEKRDQTNRLVHRPRTSEYNMHLSSRKLYM